VNSSREDAKARRDVEESAADESAAGSAHQLQCATVDKDGVEGWPQVCGEPAHPLRVFAPSRAPARVRRPRPRKWCKSLSGRAGGSCTTSWDAA
jgi:hypothetical protein